MAFRYLRDRLFLICVGLYCVNRWVLEARMPGAFFPSHLNDLICIPFCVPIMLFMLRKLRLRRDDSPPHSYEIIVPLLVLAFVFEIWLPTTAAFGGLAIADHLDVFYYTLGALISAAVWQVQYRKADPAETSTRTSP